MFPILPVHGGGGKKGGKKKRPRPVARPSAPGAKKKKGPAAAAAPPSKAGPSVEATDAAEAAVTNAAAPPVEEAAVDVAVALLEGKYPPSEAPASVGGAPTPINNADAPTDATKPAAPAAEATKPKSITKSVKAKVRPKKGGRIIKPIKPKAKKGARVAKPVATPGTGAASSKDHGDSNGADAINDKPAEGDNVNTNDASATFNNQAHSRAAQEEEDPLILAAEAAAALMEDLPQNAGDVADIPLGFLDAVGTNVEFAAAAMREGQHNREGGQGSGDDKGAKDAMHSTMEGSADAKGNNLLPQPKFTATKKAIAVGSLTNPLGGEVKTFETKVPQSQGMSTTQRNFLSYYYGQEAASGNSLAIGARRKGSLEEDEEIIEEEGGEADGAVGATNDKELAKENEGGVPTAMPQWGGGTLRDSIATLKRSSVVRKDAGGKNIKFLPKDEEANLVADETKPNADNTTAEPLGEANEEETDARDDSQPESHTGPQVEIGADGQITIAQDSLLPNPDTRKSTALIDEELGGAVVEDETPSQLGAIQARYDSYTTQPRQKPARWDVNETRLFYRALRQCGSDFTTMGAFLPGRTRAQLKRKFKMESRKNPRLVDMALDPRSRVRLDLSVFGDKLEIPDEVPTFQRVTPVDSPAPGPAAVNENDASQDADKTAGVEDGGKASRNTERNFDYLFEQDDGATATDRGGEVVEEEYEPPVGQKAAPHLADKNDPVRGEVATGNEQPATLGDDDATKMAKADRDAPKAASASIVPLAPVIQKTKGTKKARFKAKPKARKPKKK